MVPVIFINCEERNFIDDFFMGNKPFETRSADTLSRFAWSTVYLAETGRDRPPVVRCTATIGEPIKICDQKTWEAARPGTCIKPGSRYDWNENTKQKYLYPVFNVRPVSEFIPSGLRHGRVWMEDK